MTLITQNDEYCLQRNGRQDACIFYATCQMVALSMTHELEYMPTPLEYYDLMPINFKTLRNAIYKTS